MGSTPPAGLRGRPGRGAGWQAAHKERVSGEAPNLAAASSSGVRAPTPRERRPATRTLPREEGENFISWSLPPWTES